MTFLTPSILWGLFAAALPILIHLFSLRNTREVEFSTLKFIKELEHETIKKLKLKQWLLVIIRVLIIICLVMMFARPVQRGFASGWKVGEVESQVAIVLDNSASMSTDSEGGSSIKHAQKTVMEIISVYDTPANLEIYQTCPPEKVFSGGMDELTEIRKAVNSIPSSNSSDDLWHDVDSILTSMTADVPNLECFIISDFHDLPADDFNTSTNADSTDSGWRYYCVKIPEFENNLSLRGVEVLNQVRMPNHLLKINTSVRNDGKLARKNIPIELFLNDERVGQVVSDFEAGQVREFLFQAYSGSNGIVKGEVRLPGDDYQLDNSYYFNLSIPSLINCTIVGASQDQVHLLQTALRSIDDGNNYVFTESRIGSDPQALFLAETDILILYNPDKLSPAVLEEIQAFLNNGGGVIIFSGDKTAEANDREMEQLLNLPRTRLVHQLEGEAFYSVDLYKQNHPLLEDLELRNINDELPQVYAYVDISVNRSHQTILKLSNNRPFLLDIESGPGRIFYFTSLLDLRWNDLGMRGLIVPILHRMLMLLATDETNIQPILVDGTKSIKLDRELLKNEWSMITPSGKRILLNPDLVNEVLLINQTGELGLYQVLVDGTQFTSFTAQLSEHEYLSRFAEEKDVISKMPADRARWIKANENLSTVLKETRFGRSLWRTFLIIAIILMAAETIVGRIRTTGIKQQSDELR